MTTHTITIYAGSSNGGSLDPDEPDHRANQIRLGGIYGEWGRRYAVALDVPDDLLSASARRMIALMDGDFTGGPIRAGLPHLAIQRRRVGIERAAEILGYRAAAAQALLDTYGEESVGEVVGLEAMADGLLPHGRSEALLARELNMLASRPGLHVRMPGGAAEPVDIDGARIDETVQAARWERLLRRTSAGMSA